MPVSVYYGKKFKKSFSLRIKSGSTLEARFLERLNMYCIGVSGPPVNAHKLTGKLGLHSFSVTGDIRVIFKPDFKLGVIELVDIGSHNQVY